MFIPKSRLRWIALLAQLSCAVFIYWLFFVHDWQWAPADVFARAFGREPSQTVNNLQCRTYLALKGCNTFKLAYNAPPETIQALLNTLEYEQLETETRIEYFDPDQWSEEFQHLLPLKSQQIKIYRYTGTVRPTQTIAVDEARSLVLVDVGFGPGCTP